MVLFGNLTNLPKEVIMAKKKRSKARANSREIGGTTSQIVVPRNPLVNHPLMRKGGIHQKSKSALRSTVRRETKQLVRDRASAIMGMSRFDKNTTTALCKKGSVIF